MVERSDRFNRKAETMLTLTDNATTIVKSLTADQPDTAGLRITAEGPASNTLSVAAVTGAEDGDQVVEQDGALVFLDSNAAQRLDDKVLDADVSEGGVRFAIGDQP